VAYSRSLLERYHSYNKLFPFISPLAPFLDPGSTIFEAPEKYGYRLLCRTVEEHRQAMLAPSWKYILNYETEWMTRDEITYSTYEAGRRLNRLKAEFGLIDSKTAEAVETRIDKAVHLMKEIDRIMALPEEPERQTALEFLFSGNHPLYHYSMSTICEKKELEWPTRFIRMNFFKILKTLLTRRKPNVSIPSSRSSS
jgi:hypothetical protein